MNQKQSKNIKRLSVNLDEEIHYLIRNRAAQKNMTIKQWILEAIMENIKKEQELGFE